MHRVPDLSRELCREPGPGDKVSGRTQRTSEPARNMEELFLGRVSSKVLRLADDTAVWVFH